MKRRSPRGLDPEEKALWERVAKTATPLEERAPRARSVKPAVERPGADAPERKAIAPFQIGSKTQTRLPQNQIAPSVGASLDAAPVRMDQKAFGRMKRGKSKPEARIDLHGMRLDEARSELLAFIHSAHARGKRLVLVITGKGRVSDDSGPIPVRTGVLRHQVPDWLSRPPLSALVLQVAQAHQKHGGSGAFYVYLRR